MLKPHSNESSSPVQWIQTPPLGVCMAELGLAHELWVKGRMMWPYTVLLQVKQECLIIVEICSLLMKYENTWRLVLPDLLHYLPVLNQLILVEIPSKLGVEQMIGSRVPHFFRLLPPPHSTCIIYHNSVSLSKPQNLPASAVNINLVINCKCISSGGAHTRESVGIMSVCLF